MGFRGSVPSVVYNDLHGEGTGTAIQRLDAFTGLETDDEEVTTSRIDAGEASCVVAARTPDAEFLVTDDFRALPKLQELVAADVVFSPVVFHALGKRGVLSNAAANAAFERIAESRDWLGAPIHRYANRLFE